jgi:hypothetical protein
MTDDIADITERLRRAAPFMRASGKAGIVGQHAETAEEAAEEITRLRRQNQELREENEVLKEELGAWQKGNCELSGEAYRFREALTRIVNIEHATDPEMDYPEQCEILFNFVVCASIIAAEALTGERVTYPIPPLASQEATGKARTGEEASGATHVPE